MYHFSLYSYPTSFGEKYYHFSLLCKQMDPRMYWLITQEAVAPSRHDWKIVVWDVKPEHKQINKWTFI